MGFSPPKQTPRGVAEHDPPAIIASLPQEMPHVEVVDEVAETTPSEEEQAAVAPVLAEEKQEIVDTPTALPISQAPTSPTTQNSPSTLQPSSSPDTIFVPGIGNIAPSGGSGMVGHSDGDINKPVGSMGGE